MTKIAKRKDIFQAAAKLFRQKGFHATRIQDVAVELGMQKGSLYYYINSKEDLLAGLVDTILNQATDEAKSIQQTKHTNNQKLSMLINNHLRIFHESLDVFGIFMSEDIELINKTSKHDIYQIIKSYENVWEEVFEEGINKGDFRADLEIKVIVKAIFGMCNWTYRWYDADKGEPLPEIARLFTDLIINGIKFSNNK